MLGCRVFNCEMVRRRCLVVEGLDGGYDSNRMIRYFVSI